MSEKVRDYIDGKLISQIDPWHGDGKKLKATKIQFLNYAGAMDLPMKELLKKSEGWKQPIVMTSLTPTEQLLARAVRFALGQIFKDKALLLLENLSEDNGFECWRLILQRVKPITSGALRTERLKLHT